MNLNWLRDPQRYAVDQERWRHDDALRGYGEYAIFILLWRIQDHNAGLVGRCPNCFLSQGKTAKAYNQTADPYCPECFGTTFEGGYKARLVRLSLWDTTAERQNEGRRGEAILATSAVQSTSDFLMRSDDIIIRGDNLRWQVNTIGQTTLRTGFEHAAPATTSVGFNYGEAQRIDQSHVAYRISPTDPAEVAAILTIPDQTPPDFSEFEEIRGPLIGGA